MFLNSRIQTLKLQNIYVRHCRVRQNSYLYHSFWSQKKKHEKESYKIPRQDKKADQEVIMEIKYDLKEHQEQWPWKSQLFRDCVLL